MIPERHHLRPAYPLVTVLSDIHAERKVVRSKPAVNPLLFQPNHLLKPVLPGFNYLLLGKEV